MAEGAQSDRIPRDADDDYTPEAAASRRDFLAERTGASLEHVGSNSFDPALLPGNVENFIGVAQVPIGLAGPLLVDGEHAQGEFYVPLATAEGTLVASLQPRDEAAARGRRGQDHGDGRRDAARALVPLPERSRGARLRRVARRERRSPGSRPRPRRRRARAGCATSSSYSAGRILFTRFNYTTGDAAGQNLSGKATAAACVWILANYPGELEHFFLESNFATDKKSSQVNMLRTRGKRVVAEATIPNELVKRIMRSDTELMFKARQVSNLGGFMSGVNNNGAHSANGITAMFIATGQDVANVAESSAAFVYTELRENGDYYYSVTIPSLIVATYGGGTGLPTQRECLELLDCYGTGKVRKLAEIVAATVLCGELSLGSAIVAEEWVAAHDLYGRNR